MYENKQKQKRISIMYENKQKQKRISSIIDELIDLLFSIKPDEYDRFDTSDIYDDVYKLQMMLNKYCTTEKGRMKR